MYNPHDDSSHGVLMGKYSSAHNGGNTV